MQKFSEVIYKRPEQEEVKAELTKLLEEFKAAKTPEEAFAVFKRYDEYGNSVSAMSAVAYIRNSMDTTDEFYDKEKAYFDEVEPVLQEITQQFGLALVGSPHRAVMEKEFGTLMFRNVEMQLKTFSPEIIADLQEENKLCTEYDKLLASAQIAFRGETYTLAQMGPFHEDPDRAARKEARTAYTAWYMKQSETLDRIFDDLVKVRDRIAKKLGYQSFTEVGYYRMTRNCYDEKMVSVFREQIQKHIVPVSERLKAEKAKRIGVERVTVYDDALDFLSGNAKPQGTPDDIFAHGKKMYHELSPETAEFFDYMLERDLFDVLTRKGKSGGGYCYPMSALKMPFIFANFNGTSGDIDVLTHEAGHAFAFYRAFDIYPSDLQSGGYETAEVHSMSMEFFTWPWMEGFFGGQTNKYRYAHLSGALTFLPYGTMVDEFQHHIYANPGWTPARRNECWLELEAKYRPYLDQDFDFYREGRRWQAQSHIYERPFYYIDYCLAQAMALAFWAESQKDFGAAWKKYLQFVGLAGTKTFTDLVAGANLQSPFAEGCLNAVASAAAEWLDSNPVEDK
ncbi:MAG: M3 family oligoendopeptidase [Oscillospiraceae bacterium]|jgi:M3 family oligoendopeptidase|nr:M3 family oligoendopeptidase [Oscillospiraceae bacterium]